MTLETQFDSDFLEMLTRARHLAERVFGPRAAESDQAGAPPADNLRKLADAGLLGMSTPKRYGGVGAPGPVMRAYTETLARSCGVTTFVQGQHQSAASLIAGAENDELKASVLPSLASGSMMGAVAFSHLRRPGPPTMRVTREAGSYLFNGTAPWVTGWGAMTHVVLGGTLEDGRFLYAFVPLVHDETMVPSEPMRLCAMNGSGTISLTCRDLRVEPAQVMKTITRDQMSHNDVSAILGVIAQPFAVAAASIALLRSMHATRPGGPAGSAAEALDRQLYDLRCEAEVWFDRATEPGYKASALKIRSRAIDLGVRSAHAAIAASGGGANAVTHPAQRLYREAMFYTLTAQTPDVQRATLERLTDPAS